jgi:hypothetical protein
VNLWRNLSILCTFLFFLLLLDRYLAAQGQKETNDNPVCSPAEVSGICNASTVCGSDSTPCIVNIKRTGHSASATPNIPKAKGNGPFCVKAGTTITWQSSSKNTGFILDFGKATPFDSGTTLTGGSDRPVSALAVKPGCFKYSVSACKAGAVYGMCDTGRAEIVVTAGPN